MEQVLSAFGVDWRLIVIQIFNFAFLTGVLWYFLYTPVLNLIKERKEAIAKGVQDAQDAASLKENAEAERARLLTEANREASASVEKAAQHAAEKYAAIVRDAEAKAVHVVEDAAKKSEELKRRAEKESEAAIAKTAMLAAERILRERT